MSALENLLSLTEKFSGSETITLHPERCLNTRFRALDCSRCAEGCPAEGAITVARGKPNLANNRCLHCGLCLHYCPTEAFTCPDGLSGKLGQTIGALPRPTEPVDLVCPQHPHPDYGPAPHAVQTQRCLVALSPVTLLELSTLKKEIWLDDTPCAECPLGQLHPVITHIVNEANCWTSWLTDAGSISLRTEKSEPNKTSASTSRPVYQADQAPISRRELFSSFKKARQNLTTANEQIDMVKAGKSVSVSERLPHSVPRQRARILSILEDSSISNTQLPITHLPISNLYIDPTHCTACTLCAKFCPTSALNFLSDGDSFALTFNLSLCLGQNCHICVLACPEQAVSTPSAPKSPNIFAEKPLAAGELAPCQQCQQPIAHGSDLPKSCFACRSISDLFIWPER